MSILAIQKLRKMLEQIDPNEVPRGGSDPVRSTDEFVAELRDPTMRRLVLLLWKCRDSNAIAMGLLGTQKPTPAEEHNIRVTASMGRLAGQLLNTSLCMQYGFDRDLAVRDGFHIVSRSSEQARLIARAEEAPTENLPVH